MAHTANALRPEQLYAEKNEACIDSPKKARDLTKRDTWSHSVPAIYYHHVSTWWTSQSAEEGLSLTPNQTTAVNNVFNRYINALPFLIPNQNCGEPWGTQTKRLCTIHLARPLGE